MWAKTSAGLKLPRQATHQLIDDRKALILHGDKFDTVVRNIKWLAHLGDWAYELTMFINRHLNIVRRMLGMSYWSFSAASKAKVKQAVSFIGAFEKAVIADARRQGAQVVVCGHIHRATMRQVGPVLYTNCGDWMESRNAIAEHLDGRLELIRWMKLLHAYKVLRRSLLNFSRQLERDATAGTMPPRQLRFPPE
jgi:UDP-2,3-diacylglucosamine pyrophosphatase LpxH